MINGIHQALSLMLTSIVHWFMLPGIWVFHLLGQTRWGRMFGIFDDVDWKLVAIVSFLLWCGLVWMLDETIDRIRSARYRNPRQ